MKGDVTVRTKWGVAVLDELWQAIDWALMNKNSDLNVQALCRKGLRKAMADAAKAWQQMETHKKVEQVEVIEGLAKLLKSGLLGFYKSLECPRCGNWKDVKVSLYSGYATCGSCEENYDCDALEKLAEWAKKKAGITDGE